MRGKRVKDIRKNIVKSIQKLRAAGEKRILPYKTLFRRAKKAYNRGELS